VVCLLLAALTLALYNPVNHHPFVNYDDDRYVTENLHIRQGLTGDTLRWSLTSTEQANWHPLTWISHALDVSLYRMSAGGHHFSSVLLHAANVVLLYLLLVWATGRFGPSLFVALLFAVHPLQVESVAWIAERKNVLCTMFFLLALWAYGWYSRKRSWGRYLAVVALFAAALAAKPMAITLPFVLLLIDYWPGRQAARQESPSWWRLIAEKIPLFAMSAGSATITMIAQRAGGAVRAVSQFPIRVRVANAVCAYAAYLWKAAWPASLAPLYPHPGNAISAWKVWISAALLIAISSLVWRFRDRRYLVVGWLWYLGTLVPVIGVVQVGDAAMADRYTYIPMIGVFVMLAFGLADLAGRRSQAYSTALQMQPGMGQPHPLSPLTVPAVLALIALTWGTHRQIGYWNSNIDLWSHTLAVTRNNFIAEDNLGGAYILEGKEEDAHPHFEAAARINPLDPMSHSNLGTYCQTHGRIQEAIAQYQTAIALTSDASLLAQTYANLGSAQRALGDDSDARQSFVQSLRLNPMQFNAWLGLGLIQQKRGNIGDAITDLSRSVEIQPTAEAYFELGRMLTQTGHIPEAIDAYTEALKLAPGLTEAQQALNSLHQQQQ